MAQEAETLLDDFLKRMQRSRPVRNGLAALLLLGLLGIAAYSIYDLLPRHYSLTITGGDLMGNRHLLAKVLQEEGTRNGLSLRIVPESGSIEALEDVDAGKLDLALIQGGLEPRYPNVVHVATVSPELIHFLVRPEITEVKDLHAKVINLGSRGGGTRAVALDVLHFSGLQINVDYVESNYSNEDLLGLRQEKLPDAIVIVSYAPSYMADFLVKQRGYRLLEMPFPASLALRLGWVADAQVLAYTYSISPPVPSEDMKAIGTYLHLVANRRVDPRAIFQVLETLYSPEVENRFRQRFDEAKQIALPSGFELSEGTAMYLSRKDPILSARTLERLKALFGLLMSVASTLLVLWRWFSGKPKHVKDDKQFWDYAKEVSAIDDRLGELQRTGYQAADLDAALARVSELKRAVLVRAASAKLDDPGVVRTVLVCLGGTAEQIARMRAAGSEAAGRGTAARQTPISPEEETT